jgi:hypothetical protein
MDCIIVKMDPATGGRTEKTVTQSLVLAWSISSTRWPSYRICNGNKVWYWHGNCHREDGPAMPMVPKNGFIMDKELIVNPMKSFSN